MISTNSCPAGGGSRQGQSFNTKCNWHYKDLRNIEKGALEVLDFCCNNHSAITIRHLFEVHPYKAPKPHNFWPAEVCFSLW